MDDTGTDVEHSEESIILRQALAKYAVQHAGTDADLDADLEAATIELLII